MDDGKQTRTGASVDEPPGRAGLGLCGDQLPAQPPFDLARSHRGRQTREAWTKEYIAEYGGDQDWIAITGGSAGGHLSSLAALTRNDPQFRPGFEQADTRVQAAVPFFGVYDFTRSDSSVHPLMVPMVWRRMCSN